MWRKTAGPRVGLIAADALEDGRAVVQAVREDVDLRVLPGDELAVVPDELRFDHCARFPSLEVREHGRRRRVGARLAAEVSRPQTVCERPVDGRFYRGGLRLKPEPVAQQQRDREEHRERVRDAPAGDVGRGAVHGLEQARARRRRATRWAASRSSR